MEIQTGMVALCLEALEDVNIKVNKVYIYAFCDEHETFFNTFFEYVLVASPLPPIFNDIFPLHSL